MKKALLIPVSILFLFFTFVLANAEEAPQAVKDFATSTLAAFGNDPIIIEAVKAQNSKGMSLSEIQATDQKWQSTAGIDSFMQAMMDSDVGKHLVSVLESQEYYAEIFVMDNQGANVAMTGKTSDYWQGDEAKFKNSFAGGDGAVFVDEVEFDDSSQAYLTQVSVPVMDGGKAIGAITFGIDVDKVQ